MIIWFNCKITDVRPNPQPRYHLRNDDRFDIARYSFASYKPLIPLVDKFIFNLEMADAYAGREAEMEQWLRDIFPADKLSLHWYRCNNIKQWREIQSEMDDVGYDLVFPAGNEDHIFMDSNIETFAKCLEVLRADASPKAALMTSHWQESIRAVNHFGTDKSVEVPYYSIGNNDSIRVLKREFFEWYMDQAPDPEMFLFRTEQWNSIALPDNKLFVPTKEQFRHVDGYTHVGIGPEYAPPLEIPPGFFDKNIKLRFGFDNRLADWVNINPLSETLYAEDGQGADYRWMPNDIPAFWVDYVSEMKETDDADWPALAEARDVDLLTQSRLTVNWPHFGVTFDSTNTPPVEWLNPHMQAIEFED